MLMPRYLFAQRLAEALMPAGVKAPRQLSAHPMVLTEKVVQRGGRKSRRRTTRVWERSA